MNEHDLHVSDRINRRSERKKVEEEKKMLEKKAILEQSKNKNFLKKMKSSTDLTSSVAEKDKDKSANKVFFGQEVLPDLSEGKRIENQLTEENCVWDEPINYELQVIEIGTY